MTGDPLDRIIESVSPGRGDDGMAKLDRAVVYRLVEVARAARPFAEPHDTTFEQYEALRAALARLDGPPPPPRPRIDKPPATERRGI